MRMWCRIAHQFTAAPVSSTTRKLGLRIRLPVRQNPKPVRWTLQGEYSWLNLWLVIHLPELYRIASAIMGDFDSRIRRVMKSPHKGKTGAKRLLNAFHYSCSGLKEAYRNEDAFRQEVLLAAILLPLAFWVNATAIGRALLIGSVLLLLIVELLNSAIETTVDRISLDEHVLAKRAKDIGSAAVLIAVVNLAVVWLLVLLG